MVCCLSSWNTLHVLTCLYKSLPRILAQIAFTGSRILGRAFMEAGRQAVRSTCLDGPIYRTRAYLPQMFVRIRWKQAVRPGAALVQEDRRHPMHSPAHIV